jgi:hypothetical protein
VLLTLNVVGTLPILIAIVGVIELAQRMGH